MSRLEDSRRRVQERLGAVRESLGREVGRRPTSLGWLLPILGLSAGLAVAALVVARRRSGKRGRELPPGSEE